MKRCLRDLRGHLTRWVYEIVEPDKWTSGERWSKDEETSVDVGETAQRVGGRKTRPCKTVSYQPVVAVDP